MDSKFLQLIKTYLISVLICGTIFSLGHYKDSFKKFTNRTPESIKPINAKYKIGDCVLKVYKTEFNKASFLYVINQAGKETYSMSMLFFNPNTDQNYVIDKSIDENSIEEVDMINPPFPVSWKKTLCPEDLFSSK